MSRWCDRSIQGARQSARRNGRQCRCVVWNSRCGNHLGQRSYASAPTGRTYARKRSDQNICLDLLARGSRPHMRRDQQRNRRQYRDRHEAKQLETLPNCPRRAPTAGMGLSDSRFKFASLGSAIALPNPVRRNWPPPTLLHRRNTQPESGTITA